MEEKLGTMKRSIAAAVGVLTGLWGWLGWLAVGWVLCMLLDYITGSAAAGKAGQWSSKRAKEGIWHKAGMMVVVIVASVTDLMIGLVMDNLTVLALPVDYPGLLCPVVLVWYMLTELGSITENAMAMGAPVPGWLVGLLAAGVNTVDKAGTAMTHSEPKE